MVHDVDKGGSVIAESSFESWGVLNWGLHKGVRLTCYFMHFRRASVKIVSYCNIDPG
jgi:hypothetical protein